jgi:hypothetical protein
MSITRYAGFTLKSAAIWVGLGITILCLVLCAFGLLAAALFIYVAHHWGTAAAAAVTALALLLLAAQVLLAGALFFHRARRRTPDIFGEATGTIAMLTSFANIFVRRDPKRAMLLALLAGAITEYFTRIE